MQPNRIKKGEVKKHSRKQRETKGNTVEGIKQNKTRNKYSLQITLYLKVILVMKLKQNKSNLDYKVTWNLKCSRSESTKSPKWRYSSKTPRLQNFTQVQLIFFFFLPFSYPNKFCVCQFMILSIQNLPKCQHTICAIDFFILPQICTYTVYTRTSLNVEFFFPPYYSNSVIFWAHMYEHKQRSCGIVPKPFYLWNVQSWCLWSDLVTSCQRTQWECREWW